MPRKDNSSADEAAQVFRQFAWHLAGQLATRPAATPVAKPAKAGAKR